MRSLHDHFLSSHWTLFLLFLQSSAQFFTQKTQERVLFFLLYRKSGNGSLFIWLLLYGFFLTLLFDIYSLLIGLIEGAENKNKGKFLMTGRIFRPYLFAQFYFWLIRIRSLAIFISLKTVVLFSAVERFISFRGDFWFFKHLKVIENRRLDLITYLGDCGLGDWIGIF